MATEYRIDIRTASGTKVAEVSDFLSLSYSKRVNEPGLLKFNLNGSHKKIPLLERNGQIEILRRNVEMGLDWYIDYYGLYQEGEYKTTGRREGFTAACPGQMSMLDWRTVAWYADTANRSVFSTLPAETILKTLVNYNAGPNATTANGRLAAGVITGLTVATNLGRGATISWACAYAELLKELQKIARVAGGDFNLVKTGNQAWSFEFYPGQLGTDRTQTVVFALERGNMSDPVYSMSHIGERTIVIVAGGNQGSGRDITLVTSGAYSSTHHYETYVDARSKAPGAYATAGAAELAKNAYTENFGFKVLQVPSTFYGKHYQLGDKVSARFKNISTTLKISGVTVLYQRGTKRESVDIEMTS